MIEERPYQRDLIDRTRESLRRHRSVLVQSPTGSGKTVLSAKMIGGAQSHEHRSYFICHRQELIEQTAKTFTEVGIPFGYIASGYPTDPYQNTQICSINTLVSRIDNIKHPKLAIWDEAHHVAAGGWSRVHDKWSGTYHVGLTATPERLDGKGLGTWFKDIILGPSVADLIKEGYLSDYKIFAPGKPDLTDVHTRMGDYKTGELADVMDNGTITGDAIGHYLRLARGKRAAVFCVSVKHSEHVAAQFRAAGVMAVHVDGKMRRQDRRAAIEGFRKGEIEVITNVEIINEGFDLPAIEAGILLRPTQSLSLFLQQVGRALRPGKEFAIILDHAGNAARHGLPDDEREWTLEDKVRSRKKGEAKEVAIRECPKCYAVHRPHPTCPNCGFVYEIQYREVEVQEGNLVQLDKEKLRRKRYREQSTCTSKDDLVALAKARGYKNPHGWAYYILASRGKKGRRA